MNIHYFSSSLSLPFWKTTEWFSRVISPLSPDQYGQQKTKVREYAVRFFLGLTIALTSIIAIPLKGIAETSTWISCRFFPSYIHLTEKSEPVPNNLTILSQNICALPGGLPAFFGGVDPFNRRIDSLAINGQYDLLLFQELHDPYYSIQLYKKLKNIYPHSIINVGTKPFSHNSGLAVFSKYPLKNISFTPFDKLKGKQFGINKGFLKFQLGKVTFLNTHLQPGTRENDAMIRNKQLKQINAYWNQKDKQILCGDLNCERNSDEETLKTIRSQYNDPLSDCIETATDTLTERRMRKKSAPLPLSIDYILPKKEGVTVTVEQSYDLINPENSLSDHHRLVAKISLAKV